MQLYHFFIKGSDGEPDYGYQFFVMSKDLTAAKKSVMSHPKFDEDINQMGVRVYNENKVIVTEMS